MKMNQRFQIKRILVLLVALLLIVGITGCGSTENKEQNKIAEEAAAVAPLKIITTVFPVYDWILNLLGDNPAEAEVTLLYDNGVDPHSYQPSAMDIAKISSCDLFFYVGGESDQWVKDVLKEAVNKDQIAVSLMDRLGDALIDEESIETAEPEADEKEAHEEESGEVRIDEAETGEAADDAHHHDPEYDEHVWLSLKNAEILCEVIEGVLETADPENAETYRNNSKAYLEKIRTLDQSYEETVEGAAQKTLIFADRFPFIYLIRDYGLDYYAAFNGCSAETEASFETIIFLANKTDELGLHSLMIIDGSDGKIAETIIQNTKEKDQQILMLDSLQSCSSASIQEGKTYLSVMEENLNVLKEALIN